VESAFDSRLGDISSIALDANNSMWYFFYSGNSIFGNGTAVLGRASTIVVYDEEPADIFDVIDLTNFNASSTEASNLAGNYYSGLAVSATKVFVTGEEATITLLSGTLSLAEYQSSLNAEVEVHAFVTNLASNQLYALGDGDGNFLSGPSGYVECLIPVNAVTGARQSSVRILWLTERLYLGYQSSVYVGYNRIIFVDGESQMLYVVSLRSGRILVEEEATERIGTSSYWLSFGVAEHPSVAAFTMLYASVNGTVERQVVGESSPVDTEYTSPLGDVASLAIDASTNTWYTYYQGAGHFGNGSAVVGKAVANLRIEDYLPTQPPSWNETAPSAKPTFVPTALPTFVPTASPTFVPNYIFTVHNLSTEDSIAVDVSARGGRFHGSVTVSAARVFLRGANATVSYPKDTLDRSKFAYANLTANGIIISDVHDNSLFALGDIDGEYFVGPTGYIACAIPLDAETAVRDTRRAIIWFYRSVFFTYKSGIYSGYRRFIVFDKITSEVHTVNIHTGEVTSSGDVIDRAAPTSPSWHSFGIAEHPYQNESGIIYASLDGYLERQKVSVYDYSVVPLSKVNLGDVASVAVDNTTNRWYFYYTGEGDFGTSQAILGHASASAAFAVAQPTSYPTSFPSAPGLEEDIFCVATLTDVNATVVNISTVLGNFRGNLAISSTTMFVNGDLAVVGFPKRSLRLQSAAPVKSNYTAVVTNVADGQMYALADGEGDAMNGASGYVEGLIALLANSSQRDPGKRVLWFTERIFVPYKSTVYSGYHRAVFFNKITSDAVMVNLRNGRTHVLGTAVDRLPVTLQSPQVTGVVEHPFVDEISFVYASLDGAVERQKVNFDYSIEPAWPGALGDVASITVDYTTMSWYFCYTGQGEFGTGSIVAGSASAELLLQVAAPTSQPSAQPSSSPTPKPSPRPTIAPSRGKPTTPRPTNTGTHMYFTITQVRQKPLLLLRSCGVPTLVLIIFLSPELRWLSGHVRD
jgi:uncharacterized protein YqgC (DUF456 family)